MNYDYKEELLHYITTLGYTITYGTINDIRDYLTFI